MRVNNDLQDAHTILNQKGKLKHFYTYKHRNSDYQARLDRCYISTNLSTCVKDEKCVPLNFSDHKLYIVMLAIHNQDLEMQEQDQEIRKRKNRKWIYNSKILQTKLDMEKFEEQLKTWMSKKEEYCDPIQWWEQGSQRWSR